MRLRLLISLVCPAALAAQSAPMPMSDHPMAPASHLSAVAREQIAAAERAARLLDTPEKARAAGYRPRFGDVPLQGVHWSNPALVLSGEFDINHPPTLMFVPIHGRETLVGVAYTYEVKDGAPLPDGFDGAAMWHEHPALSLPGHRLVMTHVWFIDSPYGPFAHDNPDLPFFERGMRPPPDGWLDAAQLRSLALTLALANRPASGGGRMMAGARDDSAMAQLERERDTVAVQAARLEAVRRARDRSAYRALALTVGAESSAMIATIKSIPADPITRLVLSRLIDEALAEHPAAGGP